jgi:type IV pilus assembly protein PilQ
MIQLKSELSKKVYMKKFQINKILIASLCACGLIYAHAAGIENSSAQQEQVSVDQDKLSAETATIAAAKAVVDAKEKEMSAKVMSAASITGVSSVWESSEMLKITWKTGYDGVPKTFRTENPSRLMLDWPVSMSDSLPRTMNLSNNGELKLQHFGQPNRTRAMIDFSGFATHTVAQENGSTVLTLSKTVSKEPMMAGPFKNTEMKDKAPLITKPSESIFVDRNTQAMETAMSKWKMEPLSNGAIRFTAEMSDKTIIASNLKETEGSWTLKLTKARAMDTLTKKIDTKTENHAVAGYELKNTPQGVEVKIDVKAKTEAFFYQSGSSLVLEIRPSKEEMLSLDTKQYTGDKLSLIFQSIDVRTLLQKLGDFSNQNIVLSDTVTGTMAMNLKDVPWDQALDVILEAKGLGSVKKNNVIWVAPRAEIATKGKDDSDAEQAKLDQMPLKTASYQLNYQKADAVKDLLANKDQRILSKRGAVSVDTRTNMVFVNDAQVKIDEITRLIQKIDIPVKQVLIEARIVEANENFQRELGAKFGLNESNTAGHMVSNGANGIINSSNMFNLPASTINGAAPGAFAFTLFNSALTRVLNVELSALISDGNGRIVSSPRVVTGDQVEATIEQGTEIPYQKTSTGGIVSIEFKKAVMSLNVKPQITPEGKIILDLRINKDSVGTTTIAGPAIDTKKVNTQVLVENGGTIAIGGIIAEEERNVTNKVPFLGDLPFVGALFRQSSKVTSRKELLVLITPKIVTETGGLK